MAMKYTKSTQKGINHANADNIQNVQTERGFHPGKPRSVCTVNRLSKCVQTIERPDFLNFSVEFRGLLNSSSRPDESPLQKTALIVFLIEEI